MSSQTLWIVCALLIAVVVAESNKQSPQRLAAETVATLSRRFLEHVQYRRGAQLESIQKMANTLTSTLRRRGVDSHSGAQLESIQKIARRSAQLESIQKMANTLTSNLRRRGVDKRSAGAEHEAQLATSIEQAVESGKRVLGRSRLMAAKRTFDEDHNKLLTRRGIVNRTAGAEHEAQLATSIEQAVEKGKRVLGRSRLMAAKRTFDEDHKKLLIRSALGKLHQQVGVQRALDSKHKREQDTISKLNASLAKVKGMVQKMRK